MWEFATNNTNDFIFIVMIVMGGLALIASSIAEAFKKN